MIYLHSDQRVDIIFKGTVSNLGAFLDPRSTSQYHGMLSPLTRDLDHKEPIESGDGFQGLSLSNDQISISLIIPKISSTFDTLIIAAGLLPELNQAESAVMQIESLDIFTS